MKHFAIATMIALLTVSPVKADDTDKGFSLMEEGARLLLRGLMQEMEPALDDMRKYSQEIEPGLRQLVEEMGPALVELMSRIDDFTAYHPPEILPNGDIIFRRKNPLEKKQDDGEGEEIDL